MFILYRLFILLILSYLSLGINLSDSEHQANAKYDSEGVEIALVLSIIQYTI
jgi:hypothetical protein